MQNDFSASFDYSGLETDDNDLSLQPYRRKREPRGSALIKLMLGVSIVLFIGSGTFFWLSLRGPEDTNNLRSKTPNPRTSVGNLTPEYIEVEFNGRLRDNSSIFRMPPSPDVDAAWDELSAEGFEAITVPVTAIMSARKDPSLSLQAPASWGLDRDAYIVQIDVFHQIHCLNELRKEIHYDYYYKEPPSALHREHKGHCIHILLQNLMCHSDLDIITHNWVHNDRIPEPKERPFPDFNVVKQCRDFDAILEWTKENAVKNLNEKWNALRIPSGMQLVPGDGYA